jgi:hypothetical protein
MGSLTECFGPDEIRTEKSVGPLQEKPLRQIMPRGSSLAALARALHAVQLRSSCESRSSTPRTPPVQLLLSPPNNRDRRCPPRLDGVAPNLRRCYRLMWLSARSLASPLLFGIPRRSAHPGRAVPGTLPSSHDGPAYPVRRDRETFAQSQNRVPLKPILPPRAAQPGLGSGRPPTCFRTALPRRPNRYHRPGSAD